MKKFIILFIFPLLVNCTSNSIKEVKYDEKTDPEMAYAYGRFFYEGEYAYMSFRIKTLSLENKDLTAGYQYGIIPSIKYKKSLMGVALLPGKYVLYNLYASTWSGSATLQLDNIKYSKPFYVKKGECYYLGDFYFTKKGNKFGFKEIKNNFRATTLEFKKKYSYLKALPVVDLFE